MKFTSKLILTLLTTSVALQPVNAHAMQTAIDFIKNHKYAAGAAALAGLGYYAANKAYTNSIRWDWKKINTENLTNSIAPGCHKGVTPITTIFKRHAQRLADAKDTPSTLSGDHHEWLWGAATASYQIEGDCNNNQYEPNENRVINGELVEKAGIACDGWNRYKEDIQLLKDMGVNSYRFSVEWSKIEPEAGVYDEAALNHYEDVCKELVANGIKPVITLYHYAEPNWFAQMDSFEKRENCKYFVNFCAKVYERLHPYTYLWLTFCSPETAAQGWLRGSRPPYKKDMGLMVQVLHNVLETHVDIYQKFKSLPNGNQSRIGIHKTVFQLDPWNIANPLDHLACHMGDKLMNESVYHFFKTGEFKVYVPFKVNYNKTNDYIKKGGKVLDYMGMSYYCHNYMSNFKTFREQNQDIEPHTAHPVYTVYGEGLYRAIKEMSERITKPLGIPIYVTENGIGLTEEEDQVEPDQGNKRTLQGKRYMYALARAIQDGYDVRGYLHWSLMDNYEWGTFKKRFGLYHVDYDNDLKRTKKKGAEYYESIVKGSKIY
ncbi:glycoside hydrolase family 1 protein [soil metagenome]